MNGSAIVYDPVFLRHYTGAHPENHKRLEAIVSKLKESAFSEKLSWVTPQPATPTQVEMVHDTAYVRYIEEQILTGVHYLDSDTVVCPDTWDAALTAAGAVITAVDKVADGEFRNAFCAVRPPGHHAETARAMGFCLFNNVAIGAKHAQKMRGLDKVAIIDIDVHHGNGTQNAFYNDPLVYYVSLHQWLHYPGTGHEKERGGTEALGSNLNLPMPAGAGDAEYLRKFDEDIIPSLLKFAPDIILVSAGFDAHRDDPLGDINVTEEGFAQMTRRICGLAHDLGHERVVSVLEGGYNIEALAASVEAHVRELTDCG